MDMNAVVLLGKLAAPVELREFESGSSLVRALITVRSDTPRRRVDVVPVTLWNPSPEHELLTAPVGEPLFAVGTVQRRFWSSEEGRQSRLEVVAIHIESAHKTEYEPSGGGRESVVAEVD